MDTGLLNFNEEHFDTFDDFNEYGGFEDSASLDGSRQYYSEWEDERELNGDIGLIPVSGTVAESMDLSGSPPSDIFHKMVDWSTFINIDIIGVCEDMDEDNMDQITSLHSPTMRLADEAEVYPAQKTIKAPVKKIDMDAQKYILDESDDLIDVETVYEPSNMPVLEAADALSLLEQFETSEQPNLANKSMIDIDLGKVPSSPNEIFDTPIKTEEDKQNKKVILDALPRELIARINESGKRKPITVIPPMPQKRPDKVKKIVKRPQEVKNDHDYCTNVTPYPKEPQKDSGFSSEEDDRSVIGNQPTVKNADGKLMVSLLKANTIHPNNQKKKLNLEEYKKRRFLTYSASTSHSNSPMGSSCSSPLPEDEHTKRLKHQHKLMKMAAELLNTPPKSADIKPTQKPTEHEIKVEEIPVNVENTIPPDMEMVTCVSIGVNTDVTTINKTILDTVEELADIKPLLKQASNKINSNSFITSLIENIPKVKNIKKEVATDALEEVRENLVIYYRKKDREQVKVKYKATQTDFDDGEEEEITRYRRRITRSSSVSPSRSSSSSYTRRSHRSRYESPNSSRTSSCSRSRSSSPRRLSSHMDKERSDEVNERRVIYVGRISRGTTKDDLQRRFQQFGRITRISLHFRKYGDNFGFVTFAHRESAYEALEHGNDDGYPKYDLCFGGRRIFCENDYSDLDDMREDELGRHYGTQSESVPFDILLKEAQEKLRNRKP